MSVCLSAPLGNRVSWRVLVPALKVFRILARNHTILVFSNVCSRGRYVAVTVGCWHLLSTSLHFLERKRRKEKIPRLLQFIYPHWSRESVSSNAGFLFTLLKYPFGAFISMSPHLELISFLISFVCLIAWFAWAGLIGLRGLPDLLKQDWSGWEGVSDLPE